MSWLDRLQEKKKAKLDERAMEKQKRKENSSLVRRLPTTVIIENTFLHAPPNDEYERQWIINELHRHQLELERREREQAEFVRHRLNIYQALQGTTINGNFFEDYFATREEKITMVMKQKSKPARKSNLPDWF